MQSTEESVTILNPGLRFNNVRYPASKPLRALYVTWSIVDIQVITSNCLIQDAVVLDPYARSIVGRQQYGQVAQVLSLHCLDSQVCCLSFGHVERIKA